MKTRREVLTAVTALAAGWPAVARALEQPPPLESREVRQLVTFRLLPGQLQAVIDLYGTYLLPLYRETDAIRMVRFFREVESPEALDLMVVTHYESMAAMDRANQAMSRPSSDRPPLGQLYRQIADLSLGHTDQFVELVSPPNVAPVPDRMLDVLEFVRASPGMGTTFERLLLTGLHPWEQEAPVRDVVVRSETARLVIADGWDYLRTYAIRDLAAWQSYTAARARQGAWTTASRFIEARKTMVLSEMAEMRVR
jgi:hypothetical protein